MASHVAPSFGRMMMQEPSFSRVTSSDGRAVPNDVSRSAQRVGGATLAGMPLPTDDVFAVKDFMNSGTPTPITPVQQSSGSRRPRKARALISSSTRGVQ